MKIYLVALAMVKSVHALSRKVQQYDPDLARQMRRASTSVPLNMAEGWHAHGGNRIARFNTAMTEAQRDDLVSRCLRGRRLPERGRGRRRSRSPRPHRRHHVAALQAAQVVGHAGCEPRSSQPAFRSTIRRRPVRPEQHVGCRCCARGGGSAAPGVANAKMLACTTSFWRERRERVARAPVFRPARADLQPERPGAALPPPRARCYLFPIALLPAPSGSGSGSAPTPIPAPTPPPLLRD